MLNTPHIIIVEDDILLQSSLNNLLTREGYKVTLFNCTEGVLEFIGTHQVHLIICDIVLPSEHDGIDLINKLRDNNLLGKIFISGNTNIEDRIKGLKIGADDYICKPLHGEELLLRVKAVLSRMHMGEDINNPKNILTLIPSITLNLETRILTGPISQLELSITEHTLLLALYAKKGKICDRSFLAARLTEDQDYLEGRALDNLVKRTRKKLERIAGDNNFITTYRNKGYMLIQG